MNGDDTSYLYISLPFGKGALERSDGAIVPLDLENRDYQAFLAWIDAGNEPPEGWVGPT